MIKALIVLSLIALTAAQTCPDEYYQINLFRGQILLLEGKVKFSEISSQGINILDYQLTIVATNTPNSWSEVCISQGVNCFVPLRRTHQWEHTYVNGLGVYMQSQFEDDEGDKFTVTIALGQCANDYTIEDMIACKDLLEQKRQENSALLAQLFSTLKEAASEHISAANTIDDLTDDHVDNKQKLEDLEKLNAELSATLDALNAKIIAQEEKEMNHEKLTGEACSSAQIASADAKRLAHKITAYESKVGVYELQKSSSSAFTEEDRKRYDASYSEVIETMMSFTAYNKKLGTITVEKNKQIDPEDLRAYFH